MRRIRFLFDEHIHPGVAGALRRRGVDVLTAREAGLLQAPDIRYFQLARETGRVLFTQDHGILRQLSGDFQHPGVVYCRMNTRTIRQIIDGLLLLWESTQSDDIIGQVRYL